MVRRFRAGDLDAVMSIWLNANIEAHDFIDPEYWRGNYDSVKAQIPQAEVYVSEGDAGINGFIGVVGDYVAGVFVDKASRSNGIGGQLLCAVKRDKSFYLNRGFQIAEERVNPQTSEMEYTMVLEG